MSKYFSNLTTTRRIYNWNKIFNAVRHRLEDHLINEVRYRLEGIYYDSDSKRLEILLEMYCPCDQQWKPVDGNFVGDGHWWYFTMGMKLELEVKYFDVPLYYYAK